MKLYEISDAQRRYFDKLIESAGELTPELEAEGNTICSDMKQKVADCIGYLRELTNDSEAIELEVERLKDMLVKKNDEINRFKNYMLYCLGPDCKVETPIGKLSFRKSERVEVVDESLLPEELWHHYEAPKPKPDLAKALSLHRTGIEVPGVKFVPNYSIQIK